MKHPPSNILIVDDTPGNVCVLVGLLPGYKLRVATTGPAALELASTDPLPDLILLDVVMPGMDGFEVCRRLKADPRTRAIPVIFITALGEVENETRGFEVGGVDYIAKPFIPTVVRARVETHLEIKAARDAIKSQNTELEARVNERTAELRAAVERVRRAAFDTVARLGLAVEYRDDETGQHVLRMAHSSVAIARRLGWSEEELERLLHAAPMHDVGKIATPDCILRKPGKLTPEEWAIMQRHTTTGARILSGADSDVLKLAEVVALTHHEKWDGTGYPCGLRGEDIPLPGRIVAIADVFDALTSRRPYKQPFSIEKSCAIVEEGRGKHFDPKVTDAFFAAKEEILEIRHRFADPEVAPESTS
jgi:putative two-component system response regulator